MAKIRKTYTIYTRKFDEAGKLIFEHPSIQYVNLSFAKGAMTMASLFYDRYYGFRCVCDQTKEVIDETFPRKISINS